MITLERTHAYFMQEALKEAQRAYDKGEIPVGAVIVSEQKIIARAHNQTEQLNDVTAHAEMVAITSAANHLGNKYLNECDIYITLEPCIMCAGALKWTQIRKIFYGAADPKQGFTRIGDCQVLHPKTEITKGISEPQCSKLLVDFFASKR